MSVGVARFFDGHSWNREMVIEAQRARAIANAKKSGWEAEERNFLSEPLAEEFVEKFENSHKIRLPEEYRSFLLQVGDGGDGPGLYMRPLGAPFDDSIDWEEGTIHRAPDEPNELLHSPFPHKEAVRIRPEAASIQTTSGALFLFDHGCALWDLLVVSGDEVGNIWLDRLADEVSLTPAAGDEGKRIGFANYYCRWLDG